MTTISKMPDLTGIERQTGKYGRSSLILPTGLLDIDRASRMGRPRCQRRGILVIGRVTFCSRRDGSKKYCQFPTQGQYPQSLYLKLRRVPRLTDLFGLLFLIGRRQRKTLLLLPTFTEESSNEPILDRHQPVSFFSGNIVDVPASLRPFNATNRIVQVGSLWPATAGRCCEITDTDQRFFPNNLQMTEPQPQSWLDWKLGSFTPDEWTSHADHG